MKAIKNLLSELGIYSDISNLILEYDPLDITTKAKKKYNIVIEQINDEDLDFRDLGEKPTKCFFCYGSIDK